MIRDNITKNDILDNIRKYNGLPTSFSGKILKYIIDIIIEGLNRDGKIKISGFGTFKVLKKKERLGRNPRTKIKYVINSRHVVVFSPSKNVKKNINEKK